jgi:HPt (histidine-containing phosphotransfer) domain-containing protein
VRDKELEKELGLDTQSRLAEGQVFGPAEGNRDGDAEDDGVDLERHIGELILAAHVEGLDAGKGLERFGGDGKSYMESLRSYVVHTPELLEAVRNTEVLADYAITVHGIKGSSRGISADAVGAKAEELEYAARAGDLDLIKEKNDRFILAVEEFIADLSGLLDILEGNLHRPRRDAPDPVLLAMLRNAAENYDMGGLDCAMEELERCVYESNTELVPWLREQIDKSEFGEITRRLAG